MLHLKISQFTVLFKAVATNNAADLKLSRKQEKLLVTNADYKKRSLKTQRLILKGRTIQIL